MGSLLQSPHGWAIGSSRPTVQRLHVPVAAPLGDWIAYIGTRAVPPAAHFARAETVAVAATGEEREGEERKKEGEEEDNLECEVSWIYFVLYFFK